MLMIAISPNCDEIDELLYGKRYQNISDQNISDFVSSEILERQIQEEFWNKIAKLDQNDDFYETRKNSLEIQKKELNAVFSLKKSRQRKHKKIQ